MYQITGNDIMKVYSGCQSMWHVITTDYGECSLSNANPSPVPHGPF
ncbi:MAG: hypothetical protein NT086_16715 [Proteobacteria bacterium]|nr:hypothetical protein [Pseudomonadota bacterium]